MRIIKGEDTWDEYKRANPDCQFRYDKDADTMDLYFEGSGYTVENPYSLPIDGMTPEHLLSDVCRLIEKNWFDKYQIRKLIQSICSIKGWEIDF